MNEFMPQDLAFACQSAGLLHPHGEKTSQLEDLVELAGPLLTSGDAADPSLITEVRLAAGDLVDRLGDAEIVRLLPFIRQEYARQKLPPDERP